MVYGAHGADSGNVMQSVMEAPRQEQGSVRMQMKTVPVMAVLVQMTTPHPAMNNAVLVGGILSAVQTCHNYARKM
jgi:hypothetical protein